MARGNYFSRTCLQEGTFEEPILSPLHWASSALVFRFGIPVMSHSIRSPDRKAQMRTDAVPGFIIGAQSVSSILSSNVTLFYIRRRKDFIVSSFVLLGTLIKLS